MQPHSRRVREVRQRQRVLPLEAELPPPQLLRPAALQQTRLERALPTDKAEDGASNNGLPITIGWTETTDHDEEESEEKLIHYLINE